MISLWQYEGFRRIFRVITAVWGVGFLLEAALRVAIVYDTSTGTALSLSKITPYIWVGVFMTWTVAYGRHQGKKGQQMMAAAAAVAAAAAQGPGTNDADAQPADIAKTPTRPDEGRCPDSASGQVRLGATDEVLEYQPVRDPAAMAPQRVME
jgi:hypothetical protein